MAKSSVQGEPPALRREYGSWTRLDALSLPAVRAAHHSEPALAEGEEFREAEKGFVSVREEKTNT